MIYKSRNWSFALLACLLINICLTLYAAPRRSISAAATQYSYIGYDIPLYYDVEVGQAEMTFEETTRYGLDSPFAMAEWSSAQRIMTHQGYVRLGANNRTFAIAMFHELHCMETLRRGLVNHSDSMANPHHIQHCLTYLRQTFLCNADSTLEPYDFMERDFGGRDRVGITRECRDWSALYNAADRNHAEWRP